MTTQRQPVPADADGDGQDGEEHKQPRVGLWEAIADHFTLAIGVLLTIGVAAFIVQNRQTVHLDFFALHGELPLGVGMLLSAIGGALVVVIPGSVRIVQLRRVARRHLRR